MYEALPWKDNNILRTNGKYLEVTAEMINDSSISRTYEFVYATFIDTKDRSYKGEPRFRLYSTLNPSIPEKFRFIFEVSKESEAKIIQLEFKLKDSTPFQF